MGQGQGAWDGRRMSEMPESTAPDAAVEPATAAPAPAPSPEVAAAVRELAAARAAVDTELVNLEASFRAAIDVPAKVRKQPAKAAGLAAGVGFVALGGPGKVLRGAKRAIFGPGKPLPRRMLPTEIDESLGRLGADGDKVRGLLEREFAAYLRTHTEPELKREPSRVLADTIINAARPFVLAYGKRLAGELLATDGTSFEERLAVVRGRLGGGPWTAPDLAAVVAEAKAAVGMGSRTGGTKPASEAKPASKPKGGSPGVW